MEGYRKIYYEQLRFGPPFDVPVIVDDVKKYKKFDMTRCTYFTIACDGPSPNWTLNLRDRSIPFVVMNFSGILLKPAGGPDIFETADSIEQLFNAIEENPSLYVDTDDIWLPNNLFQTPHGRGQVYRVKDKLFYEALLYRENKISEESFLRNCRELKAGILYSEKETLSFKKWALLHIEEAKSRYPKNKNLELKWREK